MMMMMMLLASGWALAARRGAARRTHSCQARNGLAGLRRLSALPLDSGSAPSPAAVVETSVSFFSTFLPFVPSLSWQTGVVHNRNSGKSTLLFTHRPRLEADEAAVKVRVEEPPCCIDTGTRRRQQARRTYVRRMNERTHSSENYNFLHNSGSR
jgi:hypothetical protein